MKKLLFLALPVLAMTFVSCYKDKNKDNASKLNNEVVFDGKSYAISSAEMTYYGDENEDNTSNVDLDIECKGIDVGFEMFVSGKETRLVSGTYRFNANGGVSTFDDGWVVFDTTDKGYVINSGEVKVDVSGTTYTVVFDCRTSTGETVVGKYTGTLRWYDESR
ncbi:MAG: hypothetical protein K2L01_04495 [Rikenellaceae bacterium]|nr:hypothetical protein [Rikenellaceae bacterium]